MNTEYKTKKKFIEALISHKFNNEVLEIVFKRKQYSVCDVTFTNKFTKEVDKGLFGAFVVLGNLTGSLKVEGKNFIINTPDGLIGYPANINEYADNFIDYIENTLIGIAG